LCAKVGDTNENECQASVIIPTIPQQQRCRLDRVAGWAGLQAGQGCRLGRVGIVEPEYAQGQLHSTRAPADSV